VLLPDATGAHMQKIVATCLVLSNASLTHAPDVFFALGTTRPQARLNAFSVISETDPKWVSGLAILRASILSPSAAGTTELKHPFAANLSFHRSAAKFSFTDSGMRGILRSGP